MFYFIVVLRYGKVLIVFRKIKILMILGHICDEVWFKHDANNGLIGLYRAGQKPHRPTKPHQSAPPCPSLECFFTDAG
jgi:hypothetical protein